MGFDLTGEQPGELGMICGGRGVLLHRSLSMPPTRPRSHSVSACADLAANGRRGWLVTVVPQGGETGAACRGGAWWTPRAPSLRDPILPVETLRELARKKGASDGLVAADGSRVYVEQVGPRETVFIFGAGHCGQKLAVVAGMVGF